MKSKQDVHAQAITGTDDSEVHVNESSIPFTEMMSEKYKLCRTEKHSESNLDDIHKPKQKKHKTGKKRISESHETVNSQEVLEAPCVEFISSDHLPSANTLSPEKSVNSTKTLKCKNAEVTPEKHKRKKRKTVQKESNESQEVDVSGYHEPVQEANSFDLDEILGFSVQKLIKSKQDAHAHSITGSEDSEVHVNESSIPFMEMMSEKYKLCRIEKHRESNLDDIHKPKQKPHKTGKKRISESKETVNSQEVLEAPCVEFISSDHLPSANTLSPEKSINSTKTLKCKNAEVTPDKHKRKKRKTVEKESNESQEVDVSGYHEPVQEANSFDLDEILESSAQKLIFDEDSKKSVDYKTVFKSYPVLSKGTDGQISGRLPEFKGHNGVSYGTWKKICKELEKEGDMATVFQSISDSEPLSKSKGQLEEVIDEEDER